MRGTRITLYNRGNEEVDEAKSKAWQNGNPYLASTLPQGSLLPTETDEGFIHAYNRTKEESDAIVAEDPVHLEEKECPRRMISGTIWERDCQPIQEILYPPFYVNHDFSAHFHD